ncbi:MAG: hypothetical protein K0R27_3457 [Xanthobacteraceae bacterium]|jgi:hypothetical protein|nr:hypothetical protein [Xanthobacteraceae bacterium]
MGSAAIYFGNNVRQSHPLGSSDFFESLPEFLFGTYARRSPIQSDCTLHNGALGPSLHSARLDIQFSHG